MSQNNKWAAILSDIDNTWQFLTDSFVANGYRFFLTPQNYHDRIEEIRELMDTLIKHNLKECMSKSNGKDLLPDIHKRSDNGF